MSAKAITGSSGSAYQARSFDGHKGAMFLLIAAGILFLYVPVIYQFGEKYFLDSDDNHSSILLLMTGYAFWIDRNALKFVSTPCEALAGAGLIATALAIYVLGRMTDVIQLLGVSLPILVMGLSLSFGGWALLGRWKFLSCLLIFVVPWLGASADALLVPLRLLLTSGATESLSMLGYPISATGVLVSVGFVQLSIAGACVGLRSMVTMVAIGALFLHFFRPRSTYAGIIFMLTVPVIALSANFIRIIVLVLAAAHFGAGGAAAIHDAAAYAEVLLAIGAFLLAAKLFHLGEGGE